MTMSWGARVKAAIHGEVDGADVRALLVAGTPSASLRQGLADRQLELELAHLKEAWRVAMDLGTIAAPLWLADALCTLAGSLVDAEAEAHPDAPGMMSALAHQRALALLQPASTLIVEASEALADPGQPHSPRPPISVAPAVGQYGALVTGSYLRGLLQGADRLEGMAQVALEDLATRSGRTPMPDWLSAGVQQLRGELAAAQARLAMIRTRSAALLPQQLRDEVAWQQLEADLWAVIDTYLRIGQVAIAPYRMPGAGRGDVSRPSAPPPAAPPRVAPSVPPRLPEPPAPPPMPPPIPPAEREPTLPQIAPAWQTAPATRVTPQPPQAPKQETPRAVPRIDVSTPVAPRDTARPMPEIGAGGPPAPHAQGAAQAPAQPESRGASDLPWEHELPRIDAPAIPKGQPASPPSGATAPSSAQPAGRHIDPGDRWLLSSRAARHRLRAAGAEDEAERRLAAFWEARAWMLSTQGQTYLSEVAALVASGAAGASGRSLNEPPYAPIYRVLAGEVMILDRRLNSGTLFAFDYAADRLLEPGPRDGVPDVRA